MTAAGYIRFGPYRVHPTQGLFRGGAEIRVTPRSLAVLYELARRSRQVVLKSELFDTVWSDTVVSDAALSSCVRELRLALGDDARQPSYIETLHGRGFRLCASGVAESADAADDELLTRRPSLVVLPFDNVGGDESAAVLACGLTHDVITLVARSRTALIIARGTAFRFAKGEHDVRSISDRLGVRYVVQGAVQVSGRRLTLWVALADARTREELWSERYERRLDDWMLLQQELAELIVASVESEVQREEIRRATLLPSSNLDAWSAYHRGLSHMYKFREEEWEQAEHWFSRSIEMEPGVPRPWAGLSFVNFERAFLDLGKERAARIQMALDCARQAVAIDGRDPMAHWALSRAHLLKGELEESKSAVDTAITLNPSYAIAQYSRGWVGLQLGENQVCHDRIGFARRLSPYDPLKFAMLGVSGLNLALMGRTDEAVELARESLQQANAHYLVTAFAAVTHAVSGELDQAGRYFSQIRKVSPDFDVDDFLTVFAFQRDRDLKRVGKAFDDMRKRVN
jgi:TolB-like protein